MTNARAILAALPLALNFEAASPAPEWVQLTPPGPRIAGRDGRAWTLDAEAVALAFRETLAEPGGVPFDIEHATETPVPGQPAPAVGWLTEVEARGGALWARVDWTEAGVKALASRSYRFLSPAFLFDPEDGRVLRLTSVGLTNRPNFRLPALNHTETPMDPAVLTALGLAPDATAAQAVTAINALRTAEQTALNRATTPDPALFVPRADYDLATNRLTALETAAAAAREAEITAAIDGATAAGKIAPASRDYHLASCRAEGGLDRFRAMIAASPVIAGGTAPKAQPATGKAGLSDEELAVCRHLGMTPDAFAAAKAAEQE